MWGQESRSRGGSGGWQRDEVDTSTSSVRRSIFEDGGPIPGLQGLFCMFCCLLSKERPLHRSVSQRSVPPQPHMVLRKCPEGVSLHLRPDAARRQS